MHVSVWWPKVQKNAHPLSVWIITALASGTPVFAKGLLWQRLSFFSPNTVALAAAEADIVFIHSTQHWGEESIETVVTVDASQRIRAMFSLERNRWNSNNRSLRGGEVSAELNPTVATIQCYFLLSVRDNISKCLGLTLIVFNLFCFYSESLFSFKMETSTLRCWFRVI